MRTQLAAWMHFIEVRDKWLSLSVSTEIPTQIKAKQGVLKWRNVILTIDAKSLY